jgi:hypothetical protein
MTQRRIELAPFLRQLLGQQHDYIPPPLPPGEQMLQTYADSMMSGRSPGYGAQVGLTPNHLVVSPMNVTGARRILGAGARIVGVPGFGGINYLLGRATPQPLAIPYSDIVQTAQGTYQLGVTGNLWALSQSKQALQARNQLLTSSLHARAWGDDGALQPVESRAQRRHR